MRRFEGKTVVVTGGNRGLGFAIAERFAAEGANAIFPGIIETDMWVYNDKVWGEMLGDYGPGELMGEWVQNIPMQRAGQGEDVSGLVAFLASDDATYITGQTINVDGGLIMSQGMVRIHSNVMELS